MSSPPTKSEPVATDAGNPRPPMPAASTLTGASGRWPAPIIPSSFEEVQRLANMAVETGLLKSTGRPGVAQACLVIMQGLELGLPPMQALQTIAVINGRCTIWGDGIPALLWANGFHLEERIEGSGASAVAICVITRPNGVRVERRFSAADARQAGLWGRPGPWAQYPQRMLQMRARGFAWRDGAADLARGLYVAEEALDVSAKGNGSGAAAVASPPLPALPATALPATDLAPADTAQATAETAAEVEDLPLSREQAQQFLDHLRDAIAADGPAAARDANASVVRRLPAQEQREALRLLEVRRLEDLETSP